MKRRPLKSVDYVDSDMVTTLKEIKRCHRGTLNYGLIQNFLEIYDLEQNLIFCPTSWSKMVLKTKTSMYFNSRIG